jgi:subtilisin family serine protease
MKKIIVFVILYSLFINVFANLDKVIYQTKVTELNQLSVRLQYEWERKHKAALKKAEQLNIPVIIDNEDVYMELSHFNEFDVPIYHIIENSNAAITISTDHVHPGGSAGLNLTGSGILVRQWDADGVRTTHQELTGRVTNGDGASPTHYHSTHVAGTIMASGVQANAKGMAYEANLKFFDWNSDTSEMATEAGLGMLLSNHSYGFGRGWVWTGSSWVWYGQSSPGEDWSFGFYNSNSEDFDAIAYDAPYYLIVESAGNDRGDGPGSDPDHPDADGPYDCVADMAVSKNVLTVAAVNDLTTTYSLPSDVVMSSFSSWGPCDDGRIKPDISANGVGLYSTDDDTDTDYTTLSGTSMAAPSTTGSLALIQEHYEETKGTGLFMRSSTLKALTLHCADEAGLNDGPDYEFGWGLMNTERMAQYISNDGINVRIEEITLTNGGTYQVTLPAVGTEPFKATICWTDPEGTPVALSLDPSDPMLVNDLDIRITKVASTYYPWSLNRLIPTNAATNSGDNSVDNVEQVYIANPATGDYTITITHKGTLVDDTGSTSTQQFGLIISGIESGYPLCNITNPTNGEVIDIGDIVTITVDASDPSRSLTNVKIYIDNILKITDYSAPYQYIWNTIGESIDYHTIKAIAIDNNLNETEDQITVRVAYPVINIFEDDFETDKGWALITEFQRGAPGGLGGDYGNPDPASAHGGSNVLGVDMTGLGAYNGDYEINLSDRAYTATSPIIDCTDFLNIQMTFWRYLNVEQPAYDHAYIDIYDGSTWHEIWSNSATITDNSWNEINIDISTYADGNTDMRIRFCIGETDGSWQYSGWNIDDFVVFGESTITIPNVPINVTISIGASDLTISWDAVSGATSYKVYSSDDPYTGFVEDTSGTFAGESWSTSVTNEKKFYYVTAVN